MADENVREGERDGVWVLDVQSSCIAGSVTSRGGENERQCVARACMRVRVAAQAVTSALHRRHCVALLCMGCSSRSSSSSSCCCIACVQAQRTSHNTNNTHMRTTNNLDTHTHTAFIQHSDSMQSHARSLARTRATHTHAPAQVEIPLLDRFAQRVADVCMSVQEFPYPRYHKDDFLGMCVSSACQNTHTHTHTHTSYT